MWNTAKIVIWFLETDLFLPQVSKRGRLLYVFRKQSHPKYEQLNTLRDQNKNTHVVVYRRYAATFSLSTHLLDTCEGYKCYSLQCQCKSILIFMLCSRADQYQYFLIDSISIILFAFLSISISLSIIFKRAYQYQYFIN